MNAEEIAALVGPVDSGKEIMFQLLTGATRPTTGSVHLAGLEPYLERDAFSRQVRVSLPLYALVIWKMQRLDR